MERGYIIWTVVAACAWGICPILERVGVLKLSPTLVILIQSASITVVMAVYLARQSGSLGQSIASIDTTTILIVVGTALVGKLLGDYAYFRAISTPAGGAEQAVALSSAYPVITLITSFMLFGKEISVTSVCGILMVVVGAGLVTFGGGAA